jgi:hypothetical protein
VNFHAEAYPEFAVRIDAVTVEPERCMVFSLRQFRNQFAHRPIGLANDMRHGAFHGLSTVFPAQFLDALRALSAGGNLCLEIALDDVRNAHVVGDEVPESFIAHAGAHDLKVPEAQSLLVHVRGIRAPAAGILPADVRPMGGNAAKCDQTPLEEHRHINVGVRDMRSRLEGIVHDQDVALAQLSLPAFDSGAHRLGKSLTEDDHAGGLRPHLRILRHQRDAEILDLVE